jgi:hypothetical protein
VANVGAANAVVAPTFIVRQPDSMFVPFGEYPHRLGMQKFGEAEAKAMVAAWNSLGGKIRRWFDECPVYIGHPDVPGQEALYPDKSAYGWVSGISVEPDGAKFAIQWNPEGKALVENSRYRFYSPYWDCDQRPTGLHPVRVISFGLTNRSNIPVPPLANAAPTDPETTPTTHEETMKMSPQLLALLGLGETADEATVIQAITAMKEKATSLENEITNLKSAQTGAEQAKQTAEQEKAKAEEAQVKMENAVSAANAAAVAARSARVESVMDRLVGEGRVLMADRPAEVTRILALANEAEVTTELGKLQQRQPQMKTTTTIGNPAAQRAAALSPQAQAQEARRLALENAVAGEIQRLDTLFGKKPSNYDMAYNNLRVTKPELFGSPGQ